MHDEVTANTLATIEKFNEVFNRHDVEAVMNLMTDDCVFESTYPPPDGHVYKGQVAVRSVWLNLFMTKPVFEFEDVFAIQDRCVVRWNYKWVDSDGKAGHIRGVDIFRVRDGKVAEKLSYVKG
jgi:ketosteroid isomerase-like protein